MALIRKSRTNKSSARAKNLAQHHSTVNQITITGLGAGIIHAIPLLCGIAPVGAVYGMAAIEHGLTPLEAILSSVMIFGGASQFLVLELWQHPLPVFTLFTTVVAVNARHILMGAALSPWLLSARRRRVYPTLYFMTDEIWGLMMNRQRQHPQPEIGEMVGAGVLFYLTWVGSTAIGALFGALLAHPEALGLDVIGVCFFTILMMMFWSGPKDILPWVCAGGVSVALSGVMVSGLNTLCGACVGIAVAVWRDQP